MIDAEILQHCMQIIKGDEWNSTGKSDVGLGLAGPLPLDGPPSPKEVQADNEQESDEDRLSDDELDPDHSVNPDVKTEDITEMECTHAGCPCLRPFKRNDVIYCDGQVSLRYLLIFDYEKLMFESVRKQMVPLILCTVRAKTCRMEMQKMLMKPLSVVLCFWVCYLLFPFIEFLPMIEFTCYIPTSRKYFDRLFGCP